MSVYDRLGESSHTTQSSIQRKTLEDLRHRVHSSLIEELGPVLYDKSFQKTSFDLEYTTHYNGS